MHPRQWRGAVATLGKREMACFWRSLLLGLRPSDFEGLGIRSPPRTPRQLIEVLVKNAAPAPVTVNGCATTPQQIRENLEAVRSLQDFDPSLGYLCSAFDPILCLVAHLFSVDVDHVLSGTKMTYRASPTPAARLVLASSVGHMRLVARH